MPTDQEFQSLINDPRFPQELLAGEGAVDRLREGFLNSPAQFTQNILHAFSRRSQKWDTPEGQHILQKLNMSKEDIVRWSL